MRQSRRWRHDVSTYLRCSQTYRVCAAPRRVAQPGVRSAAPHLHRTSRSFIICRGALHASAAEPHTLCCNVHTPHTSWSSESVRPVHTTRTSPFLVLFLAQPLSKDDAKSAARASADQAYRRQARGPQTCWGCVALRARRTARIPCILTRADAGRGAAAAGRGGGAGRGGAAPVRASRCI